MRITGVAFSLLAVVLATTPVLAGPGRDSLHIGQPTSAGGTGNPLALVIPYFFGDTSKGQFYFLAVASPSKSSSADLVFYSADCRHIDSALVPLTANDAEVLPLHDPLVTAVREGAVLITAGDGPLLAQGLWVDAVRGIGRKIDPATTGATSGAWRQYHPAWAIPFSPPDDGVTMFSTLIASCPTGVDETGAVGTPGTLGADMLRIADFEADGVTTAPAAALQAFVFDLDEKFIHNVVVPCRCVGVDPSGTGAPANFRSEVRLSELAGVAATQATYWELYALAPETDDVFMIYHGIRVKTGALNVDLFGRAWSAHSRRAIRR
jgi:hypothetical protein